MSEQDVIKHGMIEQGTIEQGTDSFTAAPVLRIDGLSVDYTVRGVPHVAASDVSLTLREGEFLALVGESGSGKTTTAHAAVGLLPPNARVSSGAIRLGDQDISRWGDRKLSRVRGRHIGFVPQDPTVSLNPVQRIGVQVAESLRIHGVVPRKDIPVRVIEVLSEAGLPDPAAVARRYPHELSGGMRQRVLIGIALSCHPELVVADEPTSGLDVTVQKSVLDHLGERVRSAGAAVLFITHDLAIAAERADRIAVMHSGRIVEQGPSAQVLSSPGHPYTRRLLAAAPSLASTRIRPRTAPAPILADSNAPVLRVRDLVKDFATPVPGERARTLRAVDGVSFDVPRGSTYALVGQSGSGKTTTARIVMRLEQATSGTVRIGDLDALAARGGALRELRRRMQLVYQNPYASLNPRMSVGEIIEAPLRAFHLGSRAERAARVADLLEHVALPASTAERRPSALSGGQRQRVAIARALALNPDLLVLDEPVSALDVSLQDQILRLLVDLQAELGLTYLFITHDLAVVRQIADEVGVMRRGVLVEAGAVGDIFADPQHEYTQELLAAIPGRGVAAVGRR